MFFDYPNLVDYELFSEMWEELQTILDTMGGV